MKKSPIVAGLILCALMAIVVGVWAWTGRTGTTQVEQWVGRHLVEALQSRINPRITWQSLDYRAPLTVVVDGLQIEDSGLAILKAQSLTLGLAETPRPNEPIRIERVELDSPTFQFVDGPGGELIGWSHFIRRPAEEHGQAAGLDDRLHLRHLLMRHAALVVRRGQDEPPMTLAGIEATLDIPAQPDDPGWYNLAADAKIEGLVHFQLNGRLETGTANILLEPLHLSARLAEPQYEVLPPRIQKVLRAYNVLGELDLTIRGAIPVRQLSESRLSADVQLHSGSLRWNELQVDVAHLAVGADVQDGKLEVVFNGEVVANPAGAPLRDSAAASSPARHGIASRRLALAGSWLDGLGPASGRLPDGLFRRCRGAGWPAGAPSSEPDERLSTQHPAPAPGALPARVSGRVSTDLRGAEPTALAAECRDLQARVVAQLLHKDLPENFDLTGRINASAQGVLRGPEWQDADVQAELQVVDAEVKVNAAAVHIPRADLAGALRQRAVSFDYKMNPFSGIVEGRGQLGFDSPGPMDLTWAIRGAELQDILSAAGRKSKSASGRLEANGALALETRRLRETVRGWAHGSIEEAELMNTPVIGGLLRILQKSLAATPLPIPGLLDNATFKCSVFPDHVVVEELEMQCQIMAARGSGRVGYDGRIDFLFNAGPIEKLESYLGQLGELLSLVSDRLVSYKVTGTLTAPQYEVRPLGLGGP